MKFLNGPQYQKKLTRIIMYGFFISLLFYTARLIAELQSIGVIIRKYAGLSHFYTELLPTFLLYIIASTFTFFYSYKKERSPLQDFTSLIVIILIVCFGLIPYGYTFYLEGYESYRGWVYHLIICMLFIACTLFFLLAEYKLNLKNVKKAKLSLYIVMSIILYVYSKFFSNKNIVKFWIINDLIHLFIILLLAAIIALIYYIFDKAEDDNLDSYNHPRKKEG